MEQKLLEKLCCEYNLGELIQSPTRLVGGFMHKMYSLFTTQGKYAVKLLNPFIMQREDAMDNYRAAEAFETMLEQTDIPILPALTARGKKMQCMEGQYFYLYEWYDGKALKSEEITEFHCEKVGGILAKIHGLKLPQTAGVEQEAVAELREEKYERNELHIDWDGYIEKLAEKNRELSELLRENRALLYESQEKGNEAIKKLPATVAICHNDMDSKNVLWKGEGCRIIDLECLSYSSPIMELYELALCWSGYEVCNIDFNLFQSFIRAYEKAGGTLTTDWETVYYSNNGRLEWLEYNLKRALGIECSEEEIELGIGQVKETIAHVIYYHKAKDSILDCVNRITRNKIALEPLGLKHLKTVHEYASDLENTKYMVHLPNETIEETRAFLERKEAEWQKEIPESYEFAVLLGDAHIGAVCAYLNEERTEAEIGWIINKRYWRKGYAYEAATLLLDFCKKELNIHKFTAVCDTENVGSYRVMEKLGMKRVCVQGGRKNRASEEFSREYQYEM
ncbi:MAG: GNAT family N-acetyltransferase [Lachnospiraceae bacterium]|nr:GNAT family N-acetyltransferase [Lachnospiraceae bacterium]